MIHHPTIGRTYIKVRYLYIFWAPKDPPYLLGEKTTAGIYVWDRWKLVPEDVETVAQSRKATITQMPLDLI